MHSRDQTERRQRLARLGLGIVLLLLWETYDPHLIARLETRIEVFPARCAPQTEDVGRTRLRDDYDLFETPYHPPGRVLNRPGLYLPGPGVPPDHKPAFHGQAFHPPNPLSRWFLHYEPCRTRAPPA